jgi:putative YphP/YqiW family bacilliredoxin
VVYTRIVDWTDRGTCVLFGDGAGAVLLSAGEGAGTNQDRGLLSTHLHADGRHGDILAVEGGAGSTGGTGLLRMAGKEVFRHAVSKLAAVVDEALTAKGTVLVVVNSICGCAAGSMRPAVGMALQNDRIPEVLTTVFAGQDLDATQRARDFFVGYPPSSPSVALMKGGDIVYMMERHEIEGRHPQHIAAALVEAFLQKSR